MRNITKRQAESALKAVIKAHKDYIGAGYNGPTLFAPDHPCGEGKWIISWEEGPYEWPFRATGGGIDDEVYSLLVGEGVPSEAALKAATKDPVKFPKGVFVECQTHYSISLHPDD